MGKNSSQRVNVKKPHNFAFKSATDNCSFQLNTGPKAIVISKQTVVITKENK